MQVTENTFLKFIDFQEFTFWDVKRYSGYQISFNFEKIQLKKILSKVDIEWVEIQDEKEYPILGVRAQGKGVYINRIAKGKELTMRRYQKSQANLLFYCKVRTINGQWGIIHPEFENSYGSSNMQYLKVDTNKISLQYFELLLSIEKLTKKWDENKIGADGRHFTLTTLLSLEIPLPPLEIQNKVVEVYQKNILEAEQAEAKSVELEKEIESYLMEELGIKIEERKKRSGLHFLKFNNLTRWDVSGLVNMNSQKYDLLSLGEIYNFETSPWKKKQLDKNTMFNYVELGGVDQLKGIISHTTLLVKDAPSRATQFIHKGDLIIGTTRPYLKRFAIVSGKYDNFVCSSGFCVIKKSIKYSLNFLLEVLFSKIGVTQFEANMTGALYPAITNDKLKNNIRVPFPPLDIQEKIVAHIGELKDKVRTLKEKAEDLRESAKREFEEKIFN